MARGEGEGQVISRDVEPIHHATIRSGAPITRLRSSVRERLGHASVIGAVGSPDVIAVFKTNFILGILVGIALAVAAPLAGAELVETFSTPAKANSISADLTKVAPQVVNRAGKSDRLRPSHNAIGDSRSPKIPDGCDPAFSPLSRGAGSNFSGRCLT
jgi:hypothetical protein